MTSRLASDPFGTGKLPPGVILASRYLIKGKIAQGGMGAVYEAEEVPAGLEGGLAIKEMSFSLLGRLQEDQKEAVLNSFRREYELLSQLDHPNLVRVYRFFEEMGRQYFVMEFIEGQTLEDILDNEAMGAFLPVERVMQWAWQLCNVLNYLHSQTPPIIYRDLKPSNVMEVSETGLIKLFDFGIARYYKPGQKSDTVRFGTDGYLAPEIITNQTQTSERTDVFAFGAMLHQLLTRYDPQFDPWRRPPIRSINTNVPENIAQVVESALVMDPKKRVPNVKAFFEVLFGREAKFGQPLHAVIPSSIVLKRTETEEEFPVEEPPAPQKKAKAPEFHPDEPATLPEGQEQRLYDVTLNLGPVSRGASAFGYFEVGVPPSKTGQVKSTVDWLVPEPEQITSTDSRVRVDARTASLQFAKWDEAARSGWHKRLPRPFQSWLDLHMRNLIALPAHYEGAILISVPDATNTKLDVKIEVCPPRWLVFLGWVSTIVLMLIEVLLLLVPIWLVIAFLL